MKKVIVLILIFGSILIFYYNSSCGNKKTTILNESCREILIQSILARYEPEILLHSEIHDLDGKVLPETSQHQLELTLRKKAEKIVESGLRDGTMYCQETSSKDRGWILLPPGRWNKEERPPGRAGVLSIFWSALGMLAAVSLLIIVLPALMTSTRKAKAATTNEGYRTKAQEFVDYAKNLANFNEKHPLFDATNPNHWKKLQEFGKGVFREGAIPPKPPKRPF